MSAIVTLGGKHPIGSSRSGWTLREGVVPTMATFDFEPDDAKALLKGGPSPVTLHIKGGDPEETVDIDFLYVVTEVASDDPNIRRILVADRRWFWSYRFVWRNYNIRARTGDERRVSGPDTPPEVQPVVQDVWYKPWSTRDRRGRSPWHAREAVEDVLEWILMKEQERTGYLAKHSIDDVSFGGKLDDLPFENISIQANGDRAIRQVLGYLPEAAVKVTPKGEVVVYSRASGREFTQSNRAGSESVDLGHVQLVTNERQRPSAIRVHYSREVEVRFDFKELASRSSTKARKQDQRFLDNVLPIPDYSLAVEGRTLQQGTWIPIAKALTAWGEIPGWGTLDFPFIRAAMIPYRDLWTVPVRRGNLNTEASWMPRVAAIARHYRQTYRISPDWTAKLLSIRAYRVGIIDGETGTRAPATVYADHFELGGDRVKLNGIAGYPHPTYGVNQKSYPRGAGHPPAINADSIPAPASVSVIDEDQGILHLGYVLFPDGRFGSVFPGFVSVHGGSEDADGVPILAGPTARARDWRTKAVGWDLLPQDDPEGYPTLTSSHKVAVILTCLPGAPNDSRQLHVEEVLPSEVAHLLPPALRQGIGNSTGPVMEVYVAATPETTARVKWSDDRAKDIDRLFGVGGEPDTSVDLSKLTVNGTMLRQIAFSTAAAIYASMTDRLMGGKTVSLNPDVELEGMLSEVAHEVLPGGETQTRIRIRDTGSELDVLVTLPASAQATMLRLAQPGGRG